MAYYPKEEDLFLYFPLYVNNLEEYKTTLCPQGLSTEPVTEYKVWGFLFYQAHLNKRKHSRILKSGETRISTSNFDTKEYAVLLRRSLTVTTALAENRDRSQFLGYYKLNQYLCACLKWLKKQRYACQSVISTSMIKSEMVCMLMKMVQSRKVKDIKLTHKKNITSAINPYQLVGEIQRIKQYLWEQNKRCKKYSLSGICDMICFLTNKCGILRGESLFWCELLDFWDFMKTDEEPDPLHCVVMTILRGEMNPTRTLYGRFCFPVNER